MSRPASYQAYNVGQGSVARAQRAASSDPAGCVRAQPEYASKYDCEHNKPSDKLCVPHYLNGVGRFAPYSRDSLACRGPSAPQLAPRELDDSALIEASGWEHLDNLSLKLGMGSIATFSYRAEGQVHTVHFHQSDLVEALDMPLMYVYSKPHDAGVMRLELNMSNGRAMISFPMGRGFAVVKYAII